MIDKMGALVAYLQAAATEHDATPHTDLRVRVGTLGPVYRIKELKGVRDNRGFGLVLELDPNPLQE